MKFGMAVPLMMFIKELWRNGAETAATAESYLPFLAKLDIFESFESIKFFSKKITLTFALNTFFS